jgi:hypothetical protein
MQTFYVTGFLLNFRRMNPPEEIKRITVSSILSEALHVLTHVEKGLRRTIVALAVAPGKMLNNYLEGDRKSYQKPFSLLLIATTLFALVLNFFHNYYLIPAATTFNDRLYNNEVALEKYYSWFHIILLPAYGLVSFLLFKRLKYNYAEWLVICCYLISFVLLLLTPLHFILTSLHLNVTVHKGIQLLITEIYTVYALNAFLRSQMNWLRFVYILIVVVINFFIFMFVLRGMAYLMTV